MGVITAAEVGVAIVEVHVSDTKSEIIHGVAKEAFADKIEAIDLDVATFDVECRSLTGRGDPATQMHADTIGQLSIKIHIGRRKIKIRGQLILHVRAALAQSLKQHGI